MMQLFIFMEFNAIEIINPILIVRSHERLMRHTPSPQNLA